MHAHRQRILIIDDDFDERFLIRRALQKALRPGSTINLVHSGSEAIAYMIGEGKFADRENFPFPSLVITDLKMPGGDGFEVLEFMQANPGWNVVPRVVFSSSSNDDDVRTAYFLGASVYHLKPATNAALERRMQDLLEYWSSAEVPPVDEMGRTLPTDSTGRLGARFSKPVAGLAMKRPKRSAVEKTDLERIRRKQQ